MYRKQVRRRRAALVVLVVVCLVLISLQFSEGEDGPLHSAQDGVSSALSPLEEGASRALKPARDLVNWFDETFDARGRNEELTDEVQSLREELAATEAKLEEGRARGEIAKLAGDAELAAFKPVEARVIARSPSTWTQTLAIDEGRGAGIRPDDPVVTGDGLIGRVSSLTGGSARVTLLTDQESSVTARDLKGGSVGIVGAEVGDPNGLVFELIEGDEEIRSGDRLVTAGFSDDKLRSRFPPGIPIGEARESTPAEQELSQQVHIEPFADMTRIEFVSVLTGGPA
jgi:rod shape-determining protein MreC